MKFFTKHYKPYYGIRNISFSIIIFSLKLVKTDHAVFFDYTKLNHKQKCMLETKNGSLRRE